MSFDFDATEIAAKRLVDIESKNGIHKSVCGSQNSHEPPCGSFSVFCYPQSLQGTKGCEHGQA